jgi:hypothetical protein
MKERSLKKADSTDARKAVKQEKGSIGDFCG